MSEPINYSSPLTQALQAGPPDLGAALMSGINSGIQRPLLLAQAQRQLALQQQQDQATQDFISNPTPESVRALAALNPQGFTAIKEAHTQQDQDQQNQDVRDLSAFAALSSAGRYDDAKALAQKRIDANAAAGVQREGPQLLLNVLSTDPSKAAGIANYLLAGAVGPDKWAEAHKAVGSEARDNAELPGKISLTAAQTDQAKAAARKDQFVPVNDSDGGQTLLNIGGAGAAPAAGGAQAPAGAPVTIPGPAGQAVVAAAKKVGATDADVDYLARTATLESHGQTDAQNGSSTGVFQMQPKTFKGLGGTDIKDVGQQTVATLKNARQNAKRMTGMIGRQPTAAEVYLAHQQGAAGASALISADPSANAVQALVAAGVSPAKAKASIIGNGGDANMTAGQFVKKWGDAYAGVGAGAPADADAGDDQPQLGPGVTVAYKASGSSENRLTPEAVDYVAQQYISTGQLPPLGMGKAATANRNAVINRAQQIEAETGSTGYDAVARHAAMKTAQATLTQASKTLSAVQASEDTVAKNMDIVASLAPKGAGPTGSPMLNAPIQSLRKNVWGSPQVAQFDAAIGTVADEYAKVLTTSTGAGGTATSDSARAEAYSRLSKASTIQQLRDVMGTMRQEMASRTSSLATQRAEQLAILNSRGGTPQSAAAPAGGQRLSPAQAQALPPGTTFVGLDGVTRTRH